MTGWLPTGADSRSAVVRVAALLIGLQLAFRAWAVYGGGFYADDYRLLYDARVSPLDADYLITPFDSQLMPVGRLVAWLVEASGPLNWPAAATGTLLFQALASATCLGMLVVLFGRRWGILVPLAVYLSGALTLPALVWWAAALNQVLAQAVLFAAVAAWVAYLRSRRPGWLLLLAAVLVVGFATYVKVILVLPLLGSLALAYFSSTDGSPRGSRSGVLRVWPGWLVLAGAGAGYSALYLSTVPSIVEEPSSGVSVGLAESMLGTAFVTGALGGPWRWTSFSPPGSVADPPGWAVSLAWVVAAAVVAFGVLTRRRTLRAWLLLGLYLFAAFLLLGVSRAAILGPVGGLELRYLTDTAGVTALGIGLAFLELRGSGQASEPRPEPLLVLTRAPAAGAALLALVVAGGMVSSWLYVDRWHRDNPGVAYLDRARSDLTEARDRVDLADRVVPETVMPAYSFPYNQASRMLALAGAQVSFPEATARLAVLSDDGSVRRALIRTGTVSQPGPVPECGWPVGEDGSTIAMSGGIFEFTHWMRIGYLATQDSEVVVTAGETTVATTVRAGLHSLYVRNQGGFDEVRIDGLEAGAALCVDAVEVGEPVPGGAL